MIAYIYILMNSIIKRVIKHVGVSLDDYINDLLMI